MDVGFYATRAQADVLASRGRSEVDYDDYPDQNMFLCFIDLAQSSNYRIAHGPKKGYVRSTTFFSLIRAVTQPCADVEIVKEIGDEVLLCSPHFRGLFETILLVDQTAQQIARVASEERFPFNIRAAIGFGTVKKLSRPHLDFLGTAIDQLARVMSLRSDKTNLLMHEDAFKNAEEIISEYGPTLSLGGPQALEVAKGKQLGRNVFYREIYVQRVALSEFRQHFRPWAQARRLPDPRG